MAHATIDKQFSPKRVLNVRAVGIIAGTITLAILLMNWLHGAQIEQTRSHLQSAAERAFEDDEPSVALDLFEQYLLLNPDDETVQEKVSLILDEQGRSPKSLRRAFQINESLLRKDRSRDDLRLRQISIAARLRRYSDAAVHLKTLREKRTDLSEVWHYSGMIAMETGDFAAAQDFFTQAVARKDSVPQSYGLLADLQTDHAGDPEAAEQTLNLMIERRDSADSRAIRAAWLSRQGRHQDAIQDLWHVLREDPENIRANALLVKTVRAAGRGDTQFRMAEQFREIIQHLERVLTENPNRPQLRLYLSAALWAADERAAAIRNLESGIERDPRQRELQESLIDYLITDHQFDRARELFDQISPQMTDRSRRKFVEGRLLMAREEWLAAASAFETAVGLAGDDSDIASRSKICLALCRREAGDSGAELDSYRSLVKSDPNSERGRLGMASAWVRSGQIDLAIAEYRQLLHVEGVPAYLANLMIRRISQEPRANRDWSDVEELVSDESPAIRDEVQRMLLQADLRFAQGYPSQALDILEEAARRRPESEEIQAALQQISTSQAEQLGRRLLTVLNEDPSNVDAHTSVLRLQLTRRDSRDMVQWLNSFVSGEFFPQLGRNQRLLILGKSAIAAASSAAAEQASQEQVQTLLRYAGDAWRLLADDSPQHMVTYIRFVAQYMSVDKAIQETERMSESVSGVHQALCWLECLRRSAEDDSVGARVYEELVHLIDRDPNSVALRLVFADALIVVGRYKDAEELLVELASVQQTNGGALGRLAWLSQLVRSDAEAAMTLSERAILLSPEDPRVRSIRGLVLSESGNTEQGLDVLMSIPAEDRTTASLLFEARSRFLAGQKASATILLKTLQQRAGDLTRVEQQLMNSLQRELSHDVPRMSSR